MLSRCQPYFRSRFETLPPPDPSRSISSFIAILTDDLQLIENPATLSPFPATLTTRVKHKSFICHSYKKHGGWGYTTNELSFHQHKRGTCCCLTFADHGRRTTGHSPTSQSTSPNTPLPPARPPSASPPKSPAQSSPPLHTSSPSSAQ